MRPPLILAVAQPRTLPRGVAENARCHAAAVREAAARVVLFPELSLTGYELEAPVLEPDDPRLEPLIDVCSEKGALALAGAPVSGESGCRHIGMLAVDGHGAAVVYRKQYLGGAEALHFAPGPRPAVITVGDWRIGLAICKDTGIALHAADTAALGMDVYAAGVLEHEADWGVPEERARRIATGHAVWVAVASFAGAAGGGYDRTAGASGIWRPDGSGAARAGAGPGVVARAVISD